jgi:C_GCAxxG_C_C family probable redox protein
MNKSEIAIAKFMSGYSCAQSVIYGYAEDLEISKNIALKISNGFGSGMGKKQEVCGTISAAIMIIGLLYGRGENGVKEEHEDTYFKVRELIDKFKEKFGTINCKELLSGCDLSTVVGQKQFVQNSLYEKCSECIIFVYSILNKLDSDKTQ